MKIHTTNYFNTFIEVAPDTKADSGTPPPTKANKTVAEMQYEILAAHPYQYSSDDLLFMVYAERHDILPTELADARAAYFSKGQACMRTSPLPKTYGYGVHHNEQGLIAIYGMETETYQQYVSDSNLKKIKAMKSSK